MNSAGDADWLALEKKILAWDERVRSRERDIKALDERLRELEQRMGVLKRRLAQGTGPIAVLPSDAESH